MCKTPYPPFAPTPHSLFSLHSAPSTVVIKEKLHPFVRLSPRIMDAAEWRGRKENRAGNGKNLPSFSSVGLNFQAPIAKVSKLLRRRRRRGTTVSRIIAAAAVAARREEENCVGGVFLLLSRSRLGREPICPLLLFGYIFGGFSTVVLPGGGHKAR